jgi:hypothetical protein
MIDPRLYLPLPGAVNSFLPMAHSANGGKIGNGYIG